MRGQRKRKEDTFVICIFTAVLLICSEALSAHEATLAAEGSGIIQVQAPSSDKSQELANLPITYGLYRPGFLTEGYYLSYNQAINEPTWADPAQQGRALPGWTK